MPNDNEKIYRNSARQQPPKIRRYVPQYKIIGVEPQVIDSNSVAPGNVLITRAADNAVTDNPRTRRPSIRQPYAEATDNIKPLDRVPNVGNSREHTWSGVDQEIIDDVNFDNFELNQSKEFIDNNDFVDTDEVAHNAGFASDISIHAQKEIHKHLDSNKELKHNYLTKEELQDVIRQDTPPDLSSLEDDSYILMVNGVIISISSKEDIESQTSDFVFGTHELCDGEPIPIENIIVLKKIKIKTGLFLE